MLKKKRSYDINLVDFYSNCLLFNKYCQYNLWFGNFGEYNNIKYCKNYTQKYIYYWVHIFLLERFNLSFVIFLYKSPYFTKFVKSGFFKYLDYHFLLSLYKNSLTFDSKDKQKVKFFVKFYFQNFLKERIEKDLLILIIKGTNEIIYYEPCFINFYNLKPISINKLIIEITFIEFLRKTLDSFNKEIQKLIESVESLGEFNNQKIYIGLYKNSNNFFNESLIQKGLVVKNPLKNSKLFFKSFNVRFVKSKYERKFHLSFLISRNLQIINKVK